MGCSQYSNTQCANGHSSPRGHWPFCRHSTPASFSCTASSPSAIDGAVPSLPRTRLLLGEYPTYNLRHLDGLGQRHAGELCQSANPLARNQLILLSWDSLNMKSWEGREFGLQDPHLSRTRCATTGQGLCPALGQDGGALCKVRRKMQECAPSSCQGRQPQCSSECAGPSALPSRHCERRDTRTTRGGQSCCMGSPAQGRASSAAACEVLLQAFQNCVSCSVCSDPDDLCANSLQITTLSMVFSAKHEQSC